VLVDDELVPGDGGGICQVSSTLFNVALLADFKILTRVNHSRPVAYLPAGRDATVVYGQLDLLFRNTTGSHVLLWTEIDGRRLTISAFGTPAEDVEVAVEVTNRVSIPASDETVTKKDPALEAGKTVVREAQPGLRVKTYRVVRVGGEVVRRELIGSSYYRPVRRTIKVGTKVAGASEPRP
jgi:vancomycin resistance protein YoaR